jgi:hypothetical protein
MRRFAWLFLMVLPLSAPAMERDGVTYPDQITVDGTRLTLNGLGTREATMFKVNVYVAALYLENPSHSGDAICASDETRRLVLHFVRGLSGSDFARVFFSIWLGDDPPNDGLREGLLGLD